MDDGGYPRIRFTYTGDVEELRREHFLARVNVDAETAELMGEVSAAANQFIQSINPLTKMPVPISFSCKDCEYRAEEDEGRNGFRECWGTLADPDPHILDLYFGGKVGGINDLISDGKTSLYDVPESFLRKKDGGIGSQAQRQLIQIRRTRDNTEWVDPVLKDILSACEYPLHFIDFETSALALPYHAGMRPFENIAFQWSCHTLAAPGADLKHSEWINLEDTFPNFAFAASLMERLGRTGTVFMWATHENTILRHILLQMENRRDGSAALKEWLTFMTSAHMVDMNQLTLNHYFHPLMKGKTSIKKVLDAVWQTDSALRARFPENIKEQDGRFLSPHKSLPPLVIDGVDVSVSEGTGAIAAYQAMLYGPQRSDPESRRRWRQLLLQYCKLDTLAMVMIHQHWTYDP